jgi:hypothetical protein
MSSQPIRRWDHETALLAWLTACVSIFSFLFYFRRGEILLYGDAVAHINIARRVFDSRTPGLLQLGTVWLPLPHLLMIPFLLPTSLWQTGIGGSIPSMAAYVFGTIGIFRLVRGALDSSSQPRTTARVALWGAAIVYAANPNLIYLQATAMTESLYLVLFIWAVVYFRESMQVFENLGDNSQVVRAPLIKCGLCLAGACLTRYDAWFLAGAMGLGAVFVVLKAKNPRPVLGRGLRTFLLLAAAAPVLWLAYNAIVYRNPLEFANGPYSAKAIERRSPGATHPGDHDLPAAFIYFLKSAELNLAAGNWGRVWVLLAVGGVLASLLGGFAHLSEGETPSGQPAGRRRYGGAWSLLLLWIPLAFYPPSVAYGGVPIFMPVWWPFSYYNVRYGLELLPAFAVFATLAVYFVVRWARERAVRLAATAGAVIVLIGSYASIWRDPVCFREAWVNSRTRIALERELSEYVRALPPDSTILMYLGDHVGAFQQAGIPLRRVVNEGNHRTWKQPADPEGLWERALVNPAQHADFVIAFEDDAVSVGVQKQDLTPLAVIHVSGQPRATIYQTQAHAR